MRQGQEWMTGKTLCYGAHKSQDRRKFRSRTLVFRSEALIRQLRSCTPKSILMRGARPQTKWSTEGDVVQSSLSETEITPQCAAVFQSENTLIETLDLGLEKGRLRCSAKEGRDMIYLNETQTPLPSSIISPIDGLIFISHAFPLQEALERG